MKGLLIRNAKLSESKIIANIEAECFPEAEAASEDEITRRMNTFLDNFFVAELDGKIVGFINGNTTDKPELPDELYHDVSLHKPSGDYNTVFGLDVLPDYRRRGIGLSLLKHYVDVSKQRKKKGVILTCKDRLIHFYESGGFKNQGKSASTHGGAEWYDMHSIF